VQETGTGFTKSKSISKNENSLPIDEDGKSAAFPKTIDEAIRAY
jgi:hypothetical protein